MNVFGAWLPCDDGRVHYLLGGEPLCGKAVRPTGTAAPHVRHCGNYPDTSRDCAGCERLNAGRWAGRAATEPETEGRRCARR